MPTRRLQPVTATESQSHSQPGNLTLAHIASRWPRLFHLTEAGGWEAIREHGPLSTTALLDRFGITGRPSTCSSTMLIARRGALAI